MKSNTTLYQPSECAACPAYNEAMLKKLGVSVEAADYVVALAGNPNTGKSTVFNALTGLRQHVGNWPGKTVVRAEGGFDFNDKKYRVVDLPGTYSLQSTSTDEEIARDFILFGQPTVVVVVVDATRLERNLNLTLQILEITDHVVVALNLIDEARRHGIHIDERRLSHRLGVPVVPMVARTMQGVPDLLRAIETVANGTYVTRPHRISHRDAKLEHALEKIITAVRRDYPSLPHARWVALRLLDGDASIEQEVREHRLGDLAREEASAPFRDLVSPDYGNGDTVTEHTDLLQTAAQLRVKLGEEYHDSLMEAIYADAAQIAASGVSRDVKKTRLTFDDALDRVFTHPFGGFLTMGLMFFVIFWITITGANIPSQMLADLLLDRLYLVLHDVADVLNAPAWLSGLLIDGVYLATAWVVAVMLPPMAIFFPLFTLLEDFGYLPRVAFNLDRLFAKAGAHGKQSLSMMMGFGCNAAGVIATRIIDSPRERLIAIITNNFSICNGRWPTLILIGTIFIASSAPPALASVIAALSVVAVAGLGIIVTLLVSWGLSQTWLKGETSVFSLELPPYRPPQILKTLYTSLIDRTLIVLWRAVVMAAPAGALIWLISNIIIGDVSIAGHMVNFLNPLGLLLGLNGIILVAYLVAIPANEIIIPTILMLTLTLGGNIVGAEAGVMLELEDTLVHTVLTQVGGWTMLTAVNLMLFSLLHNPCSTTILTIWNETKSRKWTLIATLLPVAIGVLVTFSTATVARLLCIA